MKVVPFDDDGFHMDHPNGAVAFKYLLMDGEPGSTESFRYILNRREGHYVMPRHRHAFEQIRLPLTGDMNLGLPGILHQGEIGYFPEGGAYGPQEDPLEDPKQMQLVLQFAGASGIGMTAGRGRGPGNKEAQRQPRERGPQTLPRARYSDVIKFDPRRFTFRAVPGQPGVERKFFGSFSERAFWIERIKIAPGASWVSDDETARRLIVVLSGTGTAEGIEVGRFAAMQADGGDRLVVTATEELELHVIGIPPVPPATEQEEYDTVIGEAPIEFLKPDQTQTV